MKNYGLVLITALGLSVGLNGCGLFGGAKKATQNEPDSGVAGQTVSDSSVPPPSQNPEAPYEAPEGQAMAGETVQGTNVAGNAAVAAQRPQVPAEKQDLEVAVIDTQFGRIIIELDDRMAPLHSENFKKNIRTQAYNGTTFHRVIPGFIIQGGDPNTKDDDRNNDGLGDPGYTIALEKKLKHVRGAVAMARQGDKINKERRSNGAQFYICLTDISSLDGAYSVFGRVVWGMDVADQIAQVSKDERNNPLERVEIQTSLMKYRDAVEALQ